VHAFLDCKLIVTGIGSRVRRVSRSTKPAAGAGVHTAARAAQLARVYVRAPFVRDTTLARQLVANKVVDALWQMVMEDAVTDIIHDSVLTNI
jgi:hypothetical protein